MRDFSLHNSKILILLSPLTFIIAVGKCDSCLIIPHSCVNFPNPLPVLPLGPQTTSVIKGFVSRYITLD